MNAAYIQILSRVPIMTLRNTLQVAVPCDDMVDDFRTAILIKEEAEKSKCFHEDYSARHEFSLRYYAQYERSNLITTYLFFLCSAISAVKRML